MPDRKPKPGSHGLSRFLDELFAIRKDVPAGQAFVLGLIPILLILLAWTCLTWGPVEGRVISSVILPSPLEFIQAIPKVLAPEKRLGQGIVASFLRITAGFLIAALLALPLGILMGSFSRFRAAFNSLVIIGSYIPIPALIPLTMVWFGLGESQIIGFLVIASFVILLPATVKALTEVNDVFLNTAYTLGATRWQIVTRILIPIALPEIYNSLRMSFGIGFTWIIMAEMMGVESGIGYIIKNAQSRGADPAIVYIMLAIIVLIAFAIDRAWALGYRLIFSYKEAR